MAGDLSTWEFSGYEPYYMMYDHFIGDMNCIHVVVFNLEDSQDVQLSQVLFWLNFIKARISPMEPIGESVCQSDLKLHWRLNILSNSIDQVPHFIFVKHIFFEQHYRINLSLNCT